MLKFIFKLTLLIYFIKKGNEKRYKKIKDCFLIYIQIVYEMNINNE